VFPEVLHLCGARQLLLGHLQTYVQSLCLFALRLIIQREEYEKNKSVLLQCQYGSRQLKNNVCNLVPASKPGIQHSSSHDF
jgi:hypothetical protein